MWLPWERDRLLVHADTLQARGDVLGELIAAAHTLETTTDPTRARELQLRVAALEARLADPRLDELLRTLVVVQPRWESGVIVELRVADGPLPPFDPAIREALDELAEHPRVQLLQTLELPLSWFVRPVRSCLPPIADLLEDRWTALRPRVVRLTIHASDVAIVGFDVRRPLARAAFEPRRGLMVLRQGRLGERLSRLGAAENKNRALQLEASLARGDVLEVETFTRFARAFWDDSRSVRDAALAAIPRYGVELAALIPDLLRLRCSDRDWMDRLREVLAQLAGQAELVEATAPGLDLRVSDHRQWLEASARPDALERGPEPARSGTSIWTEDGEAIEWLEAMPDDRLLVELDVSRYQVRALDGQILAELQLDAPADATRVCADGRVAFAAPPGVWLWQPAASEVRVAFLDARALALTVVAHDRVLIACDDGGLREWTIDEATELARFDDRGEIEGEVPLLDPEGFVFDPALGVRTRVWGTNASRVVARVGNGYGFRGLERLVDGRLLGLALREGLYVWALEPEGVRLERHVADDAIDRLAVFTSGAVAITDRHRVARIVSADLETELGRYQIARPDLLRALGRDRLVAAFDDSVEIWDLGADVRSPRQRLRGDAAILALAVLSDGRIVTAHYGGRVWLWTPTEGW